MSYRLLCRNNKLTFPKLCLMITKCKYTTLILTTNTHATCIMLMFWAIFFLLNAQIDLYQMYIDLAPKIDVKYCWFHWHFKKKEKSMKRNTTEEATFSPHRNSQKYYSQHSRNTTERRKKCHSNFQSSS